MRRQTDGRTLPSHSASMSRTSYQRTYKKEFFKQCVDSHKKSLCSYHVILLSYVFSYNYKMPSIQGDGMQRGLLQRTAASSRNKNWNCTAHLIAHDDFIAFASLCMLNIAILVRSRMRNYYQITYIFKQCHTRPFTSPHVCYMSFPHHAFGFYQRNNMRVRV
jgi:hypothetical protein